MAPESERLRLMPFAEQTEATWGVWGPGEKGPVLATGGPGVPLRLWSPDTGDTREVGPPGATWGGWGPIAVGWCCRSVGRMAESGSLGLTR